MIRLIITEGNAELNHRTFIIPPGIEKHLRATLAGYNGDKTVDGYKRLNNILGMKSISYLEMKRIKNFFDHYMGPDESVEYQLNGGDPMKTWVNNTLQTATTAIRDFKQAKKDMGQSNAFIRKHTKDRSKTSTNTPTIAKTNSQDVHKALQTNQAFQYRESINRKVCITTEQVNLLKEAQDDIFSLQELSKLPDYKARVRYCNQHIGRPCGRGTSRATYQLTDGNVLKLAYNDAGVKQNQTEMATADSHKKLTPYIFDADTNGLWLVSEYVLPAQMQDFKKCCNLSWRHFDKFIQTCVATRNKNIEKWGDYVFDRNTLETIIRKDATGFLNTLKDYILSNPNVDDYDLIKLCNYGLTVRNNQPTIVLLDSGLTDEVLTNYY